MAKMLMGQIDHARARVRTIKAKLIGDRPKNKEEYDIECLVKALCKGEIAFTGPALQNILAQWTDDYTLNQSRYNRLNLEEVVLTHAFLPERALEETRYDREITEWNARSEKVNAEAVVVEDAIVLGDHASALAALTAFAAFEL
jgi:hypothetical protein